MWVKIDTKAYFKIFTPVSPVIYANMAEEIRKFFLEALSISPYDAIVDWKEVKEIAGEIVALFAEIQAACLDRRRSLVMTGIGEGLGRSLKGLPGYESWNVAPSYREAVDLVMMEKLERELLDPDESTAP